MSTVEQFDRIVRMVADLSRESRQGSEGTTLAELAVRFGTTRKQIEADIRALTLLGEDPDADWLLSLSVTQEADRVSIRSAGPYQRPIRFTADELLAVQLGVAQVTEENHALTHSIARILSTAEPRSHAMEGRGRVVRSVLSVANEAVANRRRLEIRYTGEQSLGGVNRTIHPYQILEQEGFSYIVAWCELSEGWRHFRVDRILDVLIAEGHFARRGDFVPSADAFQSLADSLTPVQVRFTASVAPWIRERHPGSSPERDGGVVVTYLVASPEWLVRHVLQYGAEAEVIAPQSFRDLMARYLQ